MPTVAPFGRSSKRRYLWETKASPVGPRGGAAARSVPVGRLGRQVLEAVDGDVGPAVEEGLLDGLGEDAEPAHRGEGGGLVAVAVRLDQDEFDRPRGGDRAEPVGDVVRLPQGQRAAAGAEPQDERGAMRDESMR